MIIITVFLCFLLRFVRLNVVWSFRGIAALLLLVFRSFLTLIVASLRPHLVINIIRLMAAGLLIISLVVIFRRIIMLIVHVSLLVSLPASSLAASSPLAYLVITFTFSVVFGTLLRTRDFF